MIKIIGTTHLMKKEEIINIIKKENPDVIAVELCETRYNLMVLPKLNNQKVENSKSESDTLIGKISQSIKNKADKEGIEYGSDQINSCLFAIENKIPLEFVDLDIMKTKELMEKIPNNEKEGFIKELMEFESKTLEESTKDIDVENTLKEMKTKFPIAFEFLINMRNIVIINNILKIKIKYPDKKILVILGKGHVKIIEDNIND